MRTLLIALVGTAVGVLSAQGTLVVNGDFELPDVSGNIANSPHTIGVAWGGIPGWEGNDLLPPFGSSSLSGSGQLHGPPGFYGGEPAATGAGNALLGVERTNNNVNGAKQNLGPMTDGVRYTFSADLYGNNTFASVFQLALANDSGSVLASLTDVDVSIAIDQNQTPVSFHYDAGSADDGVDLWVVLGNRDDGALTRTGIDNVVVTGGPIPEPTTIALLGIGVAGLLVARRRRS